VPKRVGKGSDVRRRRGGILWVVLILGAVSAVLGASVAGWGYWHFSRSLPRIDSLGDYKPPLITKVWDRDGKRLLASFFDQRRTLVPLETVPKVVVDAFLAAEDDGFFEHGGVDYLGIVRAVFKNVFSGRKAQGASTITQQTARAFLLTKEKTYVRKIKEILLTWRIEERFSKEEILYLYLNHIYFGAGSYGVQEASRHYFGHDVNEVSLAEAAMLASLPKSPNNYNPIRFPERAQKRREWVLDMMVKKGFSSAEDVSKAKADGLSLAPGSNPYLDVAPYYAEHVRRMLEEEYGRETLYNGGLDVRSAVDLRMQAAARSALKRGLENVDRAQGYRGPLWRAADATETKTFAARLAKKKLPAGMLWDLSKLTSAALSTEEAFDAAVSPVKPSPGLHVGVRVLEMGVTPKTAKKSKRRRRSRLASVELGGGYTGLVDLSERAWQKDLGRMGRVWGKGQRPYSWIKPGDVIWVELVGIKDKTLTLKVDQKPLIQGALVAIDPRTRDVVAMVGGYEFRDSPFNRAVQGRRQPGSAFKPIVYGAGLRSRKFTAATMISDSPKVFRNADTGNTWKPKNYAGDFEGDISVRHCLTHSKNTCSIQIAESVGAAQIRSLAQALGVESRLPNDLTISLGSGEVLPLELTNAYGSLAAGGRYAPPVFLSRVQDRHGEKLFASKTRLRQVVSPAVAFLTTSLMRSVVESGTAQSVRALGREVAGKTGTTNEQRSAWFIGFTPDLVCGVYIGFDNNDPMGRAMTGGGIAAPLWLDFMKTAVGETPKTKFAVPPGITFAAIDPKTGMLAPEGSPTARRESFITGTVPREFAPLDSASSGIDFEEEY
jgi:penicillin-binding protein 1A